MNNLFDIVIPLGPNDTNVITKQLEYTKKNIIGHRHIYIISYDPTLSFPGCITVSENIFPFSIQTVANHHGKQSRNGWYLQQLLKLYAGQIIPDILDKYLVIDSDTYFMKPTTFYDDGKCLYNYGSEHHKPYFTHMAKLHPALKRMDKLKSGICHHMMFETKYINELFDTVQLRHNNKPFYTVFLENVVDRTKSGASEYEIYFNFMRLNHPNEIKIRPLKWKNTGSLDDLEEEYDYISYHWHRRKSSEAAYC